jgi:peptidylprolyl isomerase
MSKEKIKMLVWFLIVIIVIGALVFITINKKEKPAVSNNMQNTQQIEGVKITILKEGTGNVAKSGDTVAMNYTGTLANGTVFDSNVDPKFNHVQPFIFTIGAGQVIKGWDVGVAGMKVGEKRTLEIAPEDAYGATGAGGVIPPNATISFDVELLQIKK